MHAAGALGLVVAKGEGERVTNPSPFPIFRFATTRLLDKTDPMQNGGLVSPLTLVVPRSRWFRLSLVLFWSFCVCGGFVCPRCCFTFGVGFGR